MLQRPAPHRAHPWKPYSSTPWAAILRGTFVLWITLLKWPASVSSDLLGAHWFFDMSSVAATQGREHSNVLFVARVGQGNDAVVWSKPPCGTQCSALEQRSRNVDCDIPLGEVGRDACLWKWVNNDFKHGNYFLSCKLRLCGSTLNLWVRSLWIGDPFQRIEHRIQTDIPVSCQANCCTIKRCSIWNSVMPESSLVSGKY